MNDLDDLPLPAYHLTDDLKGAEYASLELGRGCPFSCTFCSTNDFFRRKFRVKSPQRMLADMRTIAATYAIRKFDLVHDMFTVDRRRVVAFCEAMIDSGEGFRWACSARTDCVDEELLELMARAGCHGIFFGVEAGSERMQRAIDKGLDLAEARRVIATADRFEISTTVALMTGFPEEIESDLRAMADVYMYSLRHVHSSPQLNVLAPLAGTPIYSQHKDELVLEDLCSDASHQGRMQNDADRRLIRTHPQIFPNFYLLSTAGLDRHRFLELREFLIMASERLRWLLVALHRQSGVIDIFDAWREHRQALHPGLNGWSMRHYYMLESSRNEFIQFVSDRLPEFPDPACEALLGYHRALMAADSDTSAAPEGEPLSGPIRKDHVPVRERQVHVFQLDWDIQEIIDALKRDEPVVPLRRQKYYRTDVCYGGVRRLVEISPLLSRALELCDGSHTVQDFASQIGTQLDCTARWRYYAAECLLESLRNEGLIAVYRRNRIRSVRPLTPLFAAR